jgi:CheY-like chemotaxis protein
VNDSGIGIPKEKCLTLFDPFTQVDASTTREYGGTGLGLSIVKQLCHLMNGNIQVTSIQGQGSQFNFNIQVKVSNKQPKHLTKQNLKGIKLLLVDDNSTNRIVLNKQLMLWGIKVDEAACGEEALSILKSKKEGYYSMAIIDMQMPKMSGDMLCKHIREEISDLNLKLIMLTSMGKRGDAEFFSKLGFSAYLMKPIITSDLRHTLDILSDGGDVYKEATPLVTKHYISSVKPLIDKPVVNILLVEDNRINQQVAIGILKRCAFQAEVEIASNGFEALKVLRNRSSEKPFQLILMDCQMPEMDGFQATKIIRKSTQDELDCSIPIIAMTANTMKGDKEKCLAAGMNDYLSKPIQHKLVESKINQWLKKTQ